VLLRRRVVARGHRKDIKAQVLTVHTSRMDRACGQDLTRTHAPGRARVSRTCVRAGDRTQCDSTRRLRCIHPRPDTPTPKIRTATFASRLCRPIARRRSSRSRSLRSRVEEAMRRP
jgi:hypothetical protein